LLSKKIAASCPRVVVGIFGQLEQQVTRNGGHDHPHTVQAEEFEIAERIGTDIGQVAHELGDEKDCAAIDCKQPAATKNRIAAAVRLWRNRVTKTISTTPMIPDQYSGRTL